MLHPIHDFWADFPKKVKKKVSPQIHELRNNPENCIYEFCEAKKFEIKGYIEEDVKKNGPMIDS